MTGSVAIAALCAAFLIFPPDCLGADAAADPQRAANPAPPAGRGILDGRVRVQPRAWEFMPPYGKPDVSMKSARGVDRLYDELIGKSPPRGDR